MIVGEQVVVSHGEASKMEILLYTVKHASVPICGSESWVLIWEVRLEPPDKDCGVDLADIVRYGLL